MKEQILKIAKDLKRGKLDELKAERLLLNLIIANGSLLSDENLEKIISITAEINKEENCVWGHDTNLGTTSEILQEIKKLISGNNV